MEQQLQHTNNRFTKKQFPVTLVCDRANSPANIGSIFRIADSFGIEQIYFCGLDITVLSKRMLRTSRSTHEIVPYQQYDNTKETVLNLKDKGYTIFSLEITDNSIPISRCNISASEKIALVIGEENSGVSQEIIDLSKQCIHINMYGNNSSMNVAMATGIALYEITRKLSSE